MEKYNYTTMTKEEAIKAKEEAIKALEEIKKAIAWNANSWNVEKDYGVERAYVAVTEAIEKLQNI